MTSVVRIDVAGSGRTKKGKQALASSLDLNGRTEAVGAAERDHLTGRVPEGFDLANVTFPLDDKQGCATVKTNAYSVQVRAGSRVEAPNAACRALLSGRRVAQHERCHRRRQHVLDLERHSDVLIHKPGGFAGSKPLAQFCLP